MHPSIIKHLLVATSIFKGLARLSKASPVNFDLAARYDYEPGDELKRTMCFCTSDNSLEQTDNDPEAFYNTTLGHRMAYVYQFEYYNHRLDKRVLVESQPEICLTKDSPNDPYYHNTCLAWESQDRDFCADFVLDNLPLGIEKKNWWRFCYLFRGDELDDPNKRDFFTFDGGKRAIPRMRDTVETKEVVEGVCARLCDE
ncbi:MAG: hypothetical protein Q9225_007193, partial [Loekoesia sp. 1 TL-2023]